LALLNTQALGMTCLAEFVKAPASGGKSALALSISKRLACLSPVLSLALSRRFFVRCGFCFVLVHFLFQSIHALL